MERRSMKQYFEEFPAILFVCVVFIFASFMVGLIPTIILKMIFGNYVLFYGYNALATSTIIGCNILTILIYYDLRKK